MDSKTKRDILDLFIETYNKLFRPDINELKSRVDWIEQKMVTKDEFRQAYGKLDKVMGEVLAMRQEQAIHTGSHMRVDEKLADHEKRVKKLETKRVVA